MVLPSCPGISKKIPAGALVFHERQVKYRYPKVVCASTEVTIYKNSTRLRIPPKAIYKGQQSLAPRQHAVTRSANSAPALVSQP